MSRWMVGAVAAAVMLVSAAPAWAGSVTQSLGQGNFGALAVDDANQHVFVSSPSANAVLVYDFNGSLVKTIPDIYGAYGMVVHGSTLYVAENTAGAIESIDLKTLTDQGALATGLIQPLWMAYAGGKLWATVGSDCQWSCQVASVDLSGTVTVPSKTYYDPDIAASPGDPNSLYVAEDGLSPGAIYKLDVSTSSPTVAASNTFTDQENIEGLAVSPDGTRVIPASGAPYHFEELGSTKLTADGIVYPGAAYPAAVAVSPADGGLLATGLSGYDSPDLSVFQLGKPSAIFSATTGSASFLQVAPHGVALSADGTRLFAVTADNVYDTAYSLWSYGLNAKATTTTVGADPATSSSGRQVTLTATVTPTDGHGTVAFAAGGTPITGCTAVVPSATSNGATATCTTKSLPIGTDTITATYSGDVEYDGSSGTTTATVNSARYTVTVALQPSSIFANGTSTTTATVTVRNASDQPVSGEQVSLSASPSSAVTIGPVTDNGDGTYTATITSSTTTGTVIISAKDSSTVPATTGGAFLTETGNPAVTVGVSLNPTSIYADGSSTSTVTAVVRDANDQPVTGDSVSFSAYPLGSATIGPVTNNGDGTYTATITSSTTTGTAIITATDNSTTPATSGSAVLTETGCPSVTVGVRLESDELVANGHSSTTAIATVRDANGDPVIGDTVLFSATPADAVTISPVSDHRDGEYTATITSTHESGSVTIQATDVSAAPSGCAVLELGGPGGSGSEGHSVLKSLPRLARGSGAATVRSSLAPAVAPHGHGARIGSIRRHGFYAFHYRAVETGRLTIDWYRDRSGRRTLMAKLSRLVDGGRRLLVRVRLTRAGRAELAHAHVLRLRSRVSFAPNHGRVVRRGRKFRLR